VIRHGSGPIFNNIKKLYLDVVSMFKRREKIHNLSIDLTRSNKMVSFNYIIKKEKKKRQ